MAINDDTAALVAAQLTQAWAARAGAATRGAIPPPVEEVLKVYLHFKRLVAERDIKDM